VSARFERIGELGRGISGYVLEVLDRMHGEHVALKVIVGPGAAHAHARFERLHTVRHENLVRLREWVELDDGTQGFTMEIVRGPDALAWVRGADRVEARAGRPVLPMAFGQPLPENGLSEFRAVGPEGARRARALVRGLAGALDALHAAGVVHGDVRPSNVLVSEERVVLLDFDLARTDDLPAEGLASPAYLAPERAQGGPATFASDWYAAGVLLFEALTGALPFAGSAEHVTRLVATVAAPPPSLVAPGIPDDLDAVCAAWLARAPSVRAGAEAARLLAG
jgi:serine/threonine protein kinase